MKKFMLPGSFEQDSYMMTAAIFNGEHEWDISNPEANLRYVSGDIREAEKGDTILDFLSRIYDRGDYLR